MSETLNILKSVLDLKFEITQLRTDLGIVQEQCRLLLCQSTKTHQGSAAWDFNILNQMIVTNLNSIKSHAKQLEAIEIHLANIDIQYELISKQDIIDYKTLMERWDNIDLQLEEHAKSLETLSYRVSLCDCQTFHNKLEELNIKLTNIHNSIPDFASLTKLVNDTTDSFKLSIADIDAIKINITNLQDLIDSLPTYDSDILNLTSDINNLANNISNFDTIINDITAKFNDIQIKVANLDNIIQTVKCSVDDVSKKNDEQDKKIQDNNTLMCQIDTKVEALSRLVADLQKNMTVPTINLCDAWPIGSIFITINNTSPSVLLGCGTWEQIKDVFLLSAGKISAGSTGGEEEHTLTIAELPSHAHTIEVGGEHNHILGCGGGSGSGVHHGFSMDSTFSTNVSGAHDHTMLPIGNNDPHNNMPPYLAVYMWKRVA